MNYQQALDYLYSFTNYEQLPAQAYQAANFDLGRVEALLHAVGDPHLGRLTVHIAGTKGKGSVAAMTAAVLQTAGYRTGLLTSPHLCDYRERIRIDGIPIAPDALAAAVETLQPHVERYQQQAELGKLTTFEVGTVAAFLAFARAGATAQVLEVGLGGRLDATNVIPAPDVCIITPVSFDHTEILGDTLAAIAGEKAGIVKPRVPLVMAPQEAVAKQVIARACYAKGAPLVDVERVFRWMRLDSDLEGQHFKVGNVRTEFELWTPLLGAFQIENAATVVAIVKALQERDHPVTQLHLRAGLAAVRWPGRLQVVGRDPLVVLDGAHNGASAARLAAALRDDLPPATPRVLIIGVSADKDLDTIAAALAPVADAVIATRSGNPRAADPAAVADAFSRTGVEAATADDLTGALAAARSRVGAGGLICVTGSLFLVGEALRALGLEHLAVSTIEAAQPTT